MRVLPSEVLARGKGDLLFDITAERLAFGLTMYVVLLFSLSVHESAHGLAAWKLGDHTAKSEGRVSLNPIVHIDPVGTLLIPLIQIFFGFMLLGWAKPTPYNPGNFRRDVSMRAGHMLVAAAGPVSNLALALVFTGILLVTVRTGMLTTGEEPLATLVALGIQLNVVLAIFNLIPIPPLDGSKVASFGLPGAAGDRYDRIMEPYGFLILLVLFMTGIISRLMAPITSWLTLMLFRLAS